MYLKALFLLAFYLTVCQRMAVAVTASTDGFLPILSVQSEEHIISSETLNLTDQNEDVHESFLSESQIEDGESGCFNRYAYGKNIKGFELSIASVSCPNPNVYHPVAGGCKVMGNGLEHTTYSYQNLYHCSSQGIKANDYHKAIAYVQCCSI